MGVGKPYVLRATLGNSDFLRGLKALRVCLRLQGFGTWWLRVWLLSLYLKAKRLAPSLAQSASKCQRDCKRLRGGCSA